MKLIEQQLFLEFAEMVQCGVPERTVKSWEFTIKDPADKRKVLVPYTSLKEKYQALVHYKFGDPFEYVSKSPIKSLVRKDFEAEKFYLSYRFEGGKSLPKNYVDQYTTAASWLNMMKLVMADKQLLKQQLSLTPDQFLSTLTELIAANNIDLPKSSKRLKERLKGYQSEGYQHLISDKFANKNSAKVTDEVSEALLFELIAHPNQFDDTVIALNYNLKAVEMGKETITPATVGNYRRKHNYMLMQQRHGSKVWADTFAKVIPGKRPSAPLLLINSDDNNLDLFYIDIEDKTQGKYYKRLKMILVLDCFNDYVLGYAVGAEITKDLVKAAYLDAVYHVKELTGSWYMPHQIMSDRWGLKDLETFYTKLAHFFPATTGLARAKYIERFFGSDLRKILKYYNNYTGNNISAKTRGVNSEALISRKKDFPTLEEAPGQIDEIIKRLRTLDSKDGQHLTRQQEWLHAFAASAKSQEKLISDEEMIYKLGVTHSHTNKITNAGLKVSINNRQFIYDIPDALYLQNVGKTVQVIFDPKDLSRVLVTDGAGLRFVAQHHNLIPRAIADYKAGDRVKLNNAFDQKLQHAQQIGNATTARQTILRKAGVDPEALLQAGVMIKDLRHKAEEGFLISNIGGSTTAGNDEDDTSSIWDRV